MIASCCNRKELKEEGIENLVGNTALAMDILTLIHLVKLKLESILKVDMISLENTKCYNDDVDGTYDSLAVSILHALTEAEYRDIQSKLIDVNVNSVPSHYMMTKHRPDMVTKVYSATKEETDSTTTTTSDLLPKLDCVIDNAPHLDQKQRKVAPKDMDVKMLAKNYEKYEGGGYDTGMIVGGCPFFLTVMVDHHV